MFLVDLFEDVSKVAVLSYGRMNPPTIGHAKLIDKILSISGDHFIMVSHTVDNKKNPLTAEEKIKLLHKMYPGKNVFFPATKENPTIMTTASMLYQKGYTDLIVVVGDDRVAQFTQLFNQYNGVLSDDKPGYKFDTIKIVSAGERDPDADGAEGMSASKMREAAIAGNVDEFKSGLHPKLQANAQQIMSLITSRIGAIKKSVAESQLHKKQLNELRMSPGAYMKFLQSPEAKQIKVGFEFELIFRDASGQDDDYMDYEPDFDMNEDPDDISDIVYFFSHGEHASMSTYGARQLIGQLTEEYDKWLDEKVDDDFDQEYFKKWYIENEWNPDEVRAAVRDANLELSSDEVADNVKSQLNSELERHWKEQGDKWSEARDALISDDEKYSESSWLEDIGVNTMMDAMERWRLDWPHYSETGEGYNDGSRSLEEIADSLERVVGLPVMYSTEYHEVQRRPGVWIIESDGSLSPDDSSTEAGWEIISPPLQLPLAMAMSKKVFQWAASEGDAYTNNSTGLHINVSVPTPENLDYTKLVLFLGDRYILEQFRRSTNNYCKSAFKQMANSGNEVEQSIFDQLRLGIFKAASTVLQRDIGHEKRTSVHLKDGYVEFRSAGNDYLGELAGENHSNILNTVARMAYAMHIASNPDLERREYAKKLYALLAPKGGDRTSDLFARFVAGVINAVQLKDLWSKHVIGQPGVARLSPGKYELAANITNAPKVYQLTRNPIANDTVSDMARNTVFVVARDEDEARIMAPASWTTSPTWLGGVQSVKLISTNPKDVAKVNAQTAQSRNLT